MGQWTLTVKTSLPDVCHDGDEMKITTKVFSSFVEAKEEFQNIVKEFSFSKNSMFEEDGVIKYLNWYFNDCLPEEDFEGDFLSREQGQHILDCFKKALSGEIVDISAIQDVTDDIVAVKHVGDEIKIIAGEDGYINGVEPRITTNIFDMTEEKDYHLYIDDNFGQDAEASSELYMDLVFAE